MDKGVKFIRTESIYSRNEANKRRLFEEPNELEPIDSFIAKNIEQTLKKGENGVLFLGTEHKVDQILREQYRITTERFYKDPKYLIDLLRSLEVKS